MSFVNCGDTATCVWLSVLRIAVNPAHSSCLSHHVLAEVALASGSIAKAEEESRTAHCEAKGCGLYLLSLLRTRDLTRRVLKADGRGAEGEAMIDAACGMMGKDRALFAGLLA